MAESKRRRERRERLTAALRAAGGAERAANEKRYHKSRWEHWGAPLPRIDEAIRACLADAPPDEILALSARLWREPVWDLKMASSRMLTLPSVCLLYTSPSPRDRTRSRMPSSA